MVFFSFNVLIITSLCDASHRCAMQSMHWATPKTKDRMLPDQQGVSSTGLSAGQPNPAHRRASEGGAALYFGNRKAEWGTENSDVANKFRNYEI